MERDACVLALLPKTKLKRLAVETMKLLQAFYDRICSLARIVKSGEFNFYSNLIIRAICNFGRKFMVIKTFKLNDPIIIFNLSETGVRRAELGQSRRQAGANRLIWNDCLLCGVWGVASLWILGIINNVIMIIAGTLHRDTRPRCHSWHL